ncbi:hypothetical protein BGZ54_007345 [Gamsiella multidivaricata]|nr:hypothetical protein BGZ54_007345 [Gamsiella multidivaricata]
MPQTVSTNALVFNILDYNTSILRPGTANRAAEEIAKRTDGEALQDSTQDDVNDDTDDEDTQDDNLNIEGEYVDLDESSNTEDGFVDLDDADIDDGDIHLDDSQG